MNINKITVMNQIAVTTFAVLVVLGSFVLPNQAFAADLGGDYSLWSEPLSYDEPIYDSYSLWSEPLSYDDYSFYSEPLSYDDYSLWSEPLAYDDYSLYSEPLSYDSYSLYSQPLSYDYGCGSSCYSSYDYGCGSSCGSYSTPSYTTPGCTFCGGSTPRYSPPVVSQPGYSSSNINTNTVTNTNINNVTNIDNSIRDSFNNYNSNNTSLVIAQPQTPVVYHHPAPYCTINHALAGGGYYSNNSAYLSWSSQNATSAFLSNVGSVNVSGSQNVYPGYTTTYTLTVYGQNGQSATCATTVQANNYVPPTYYPPVVQQPYVALTQIPYTGFDFGPIGNSIYWASLLSFAVAGAYLALYFRGGIFALAGNMVPARASRPAFSPVAPKAPLLIEKEAAAVLAEHKVQPVVAMLRKSGTIDAMAIVASKDGSMPKIVIERN